MTTIYHGWTESETQTALRAEKRKAREIAFAVWNASQITDEEAEALQKALDSVRGADAADLGTRFTISGGEVMELDSHLESQYDEMNGDVELPF